MKLSLSQCRDLYRSFGDAWREIAENLCSDESDFSIDGRGGSAVRFIRVDEIDEIMREELAGDDYVLGCFNAWFLGNILGIDTEHVERIQKAEAFEALGAMVSSDPDKLAALQSEYVRHDGYGHHFASWDGEQNEFGEYLYFRN